MKNIVINNREGMVIGQLPHSATTHNDGGVRKPGAIVVLMPGANLVDSHDLEVLKKNESFQRNFDTKILPSSAPEQPAEKTGRPILEVVTEKDGTPVQVEDSAPLAKLKPSIIEKLIQETCVDDLLSSWISEETRPSVKKLLENRKATLSGKQAA